MIDLGHFLDEQREKNIAAYERQKERSRLNILAQTRASQDIGEIPAVAHPRVRKKAEADFRFFCERYFADTFYLTWSDDHLRVIKKIEQSVLHGGLFALAMPRAQGKSSLAEAACLWAVLTGRHEFVAFIGSDDSSAQEAIHSLRVELEDNEILSSDFPEACYPIEKLDGINNRVLRYRDKRIHLQFRSNRIVLPDIPGSKSFAAIIMARGLLGRIRNMKFKRTDGTTARPSLVIPDDPQTDQSARSPMQCVTREAILSGAILGLAGPKKKIAGIMPITVIRRDDLADRILDRKLHPEWCGDRMKMVYSFPTNDKLWAEYREIMVSSLQADLGIRLATEFYAEHRKAMDVGAKVAWSERFNADEISALQHAMNLKFRDEVAFFSEYQNEPLTDDTQDSDELLTSTDVAAKVNGLTRGHVATPCHHLTAFVDVQKKLLYYVVAAWEPDFTGYVIDYGTWPDQTLDYFRLPDVRTTLARKAPRAGVEGSVFNGLQNLVGLLVDREFKRGDGTLMRIDKILIDSAWQTQVVYRFVRQFGAANVQGSRGFGLGAAKKPFAEYGRKAGDRLGHYWRVPGARAARETRLVNIDTNFWKSFIHARFATAVGDSGSMTLWGKTSDRHRMFADHITTSEYPVCVKAGGRVVDEWQMRIENCENHFFDCLVGVAVAASMVGVARPEFLLRRLKKQRGQQKRKLSLAERRAMKRGVTNV